jgi:RNA polymerase sigma-70 factor, ECF subfamily
VVLTRDIPSLFEVSGFSIGINGLPGLIVYRPDGSVQSVAFDIVDKLVRAIYAVSNPEKLSHIVPPV